MSGSNLLLYINRLGSTRWVHSLAVSISTRSSARSKPRCVSQRPTSTSFTRHLSTTKLLRHQAVEKPKPGEGLKVTYITPENEKVTVYAKPGTNLLDLAHANDIDLEGACECSLACSTCHVIVDEDYYNKLEEPSDEENDMLDLAFGLSDTSRLGCQIQMSKDLDGITVRIPSATRNVQAEKLK
ncbi:hypothetical protein SeMB42_g02351 [Synchytrium endobioticum]|uniref:2Fe-2S ferredoxin-type domain-containing protein n=1 Tax=Synchytrium endobioticum TaxID=286115 RepID=A0A507DFN2_9FUNG|nr:hypothetical protein SeLEV6574_g04326 [Synchytrium endobioticum]TPX50155.1 hypothetical protein SeMB42_g02351 [Synchytrium endobioticum]